MAYYVIGDIHGCYDELAKMLDLIHFTESDTLICVGDYIDRGTQSFEMLKWLENAPKNVITLRGNHEQEFVANVEILLGIDNKEELETDFSAALESQALYDTAMYFIRQNAPQVLLFFDTYRTIKKLLFENSCTIADLVRWSDMISKMPYCHELNIGGKNYIIVHAGYTDEGSKKEKEDFYLYAREESIQKGKDNTTTIAGHTPTVIEDEFAFNDGRVFRYESSNRVFYDIDCGCVFKKKYDNAHLACIRLEDERVFYV